eukprot:05508.XXX_36825_35848_1 [CDS] Oithona nana genome sequencing.
MNSPRRPALAGPMPTGHHHHMASGGGSLQSSRKQSSSSGSSPVGSTRSVVFEDQDPLLPHNHKQRTSRPTKKQPLPNQRLLGNQISSNSTNELPHVHQGQQGQHRLAAADSRQFSNSTSSLASKSPSEASSVASAPPLTNKSKWHKLFSAFKKNKGPGHHGANSGNANDAFCLKHSHNCSNSFLRAGISNMKGYKKANQDR